MDVHDDFETWWNTCGEWVEPANVRRHGVSGVQRLQPTDPQQPALYIKRQIGHLYRSIIYPFGRPTILRELSAYRALEKLGIETPRVVFGGIRRHRGQWQALLVTEALTGFVDIDSWYASGAYRTCSPESRRLLMRQLALTLVKLHGAGWQHGCLYPKHIFIKANEDEMKLALLDLEKCRRRLNRKMAARKDLDQFHRHCRAMPDEDRRYFQKTGEALYQFL